MEIYKIILITIILIGTASAESGSVIIESSVQKVYGGTGSNDGTNNMSVFAFDSTDYNRIDDVRLDTIGCCTFANDFESTTFNIIYGGTGGGFAWYDRNISRIYIVFNSGDTFTSNTIVVNYSKNIWVNVSGMTHTGGGAIDVNTPFRVKEQTGSGAYWWYPTYVTNVGSTTTDNYVLTYPASNIFNLNVTKGKGVADKWTILNSSNIISQESDFNKIDIDFTNHFSVFNGLFANITLQSGAYTYVVLNASDTGGEINGNIFISKTDYNRTETVPINYNLTTDASVTDQRIKIRIPTGEVINNFILPGNNQLFNFYIPNDYPIGSYIIYLQYQLEGLSWITLDTKYFNVSTTNKISTVEFLYDTYELSQRLTAQYYTNQSGYINILDSSNNLKFNLTSLTLNTTKEINYYFKQSDPTGTWTIDLYNSTGILISSDTANVNYGIVESPTPTPTPVPTSQEDSIINSTGYMGKVFLGTLDTDENGDIADTLKNKNIGMNVFYTLVMIIFLIFIFGSWKKMTR